MAEPEDSSVFLQDGVPHLAVAAIQANEMFKHLKDAGFSKNEALYISAFMFSNLMHNFDDDDRLVDTEFDYDEKDDFGDEDNDTGEIPF